MNGNGNQQTRETLRQKRERIDKERARAREAAAAARAQAKPPGAPQAPTIDWTFEDEEDTGSDVLSPVACEFVLNLLENVAPGAVNAANRALLDVIRTKIRRAAVRNRAAVFVDAKREADDTLVAGDAAKPQDAQA